MGIRAAIEWLLCGPAEAPSPQYDRIYVRALTFDRAAIADAMAILAPSRPGHVNWGSTEFDTDGAPYSSPEAVPDAPFVLLMGDGALLQIGTEAPAMILYGDDAGEAKARAAYAALRRRGRFLVHRPRAWKFAGVVLGAIAALVGFVLVLADGPSGLGVAGAVIGLTVVAWATVSEWIAATREAWRPGPHRIR